MAVRVNGCLVREAVSNLVEAIRANPRLATGTTTVRVDWIGGTQAVGRIRQFEPVVIDEPPALGGSDRGPNPTELLLVALGACQELTLAVLAEQLGIAIDAIEVEVRGDLDLRGFLGIDPAIRPGFQRLEVAVHITSPEPPERLEELLRLAERLCPVSDMLRNPVPIETTLEITRPDPLIV
ncbi:MAG: OsmC family protein [Thermomicrobium sp.]|nr:OsmC family protein [Thermomicrobium sp.]MDW7981376.1 OsmC family protein [Thermomicrobium sp.]